MVIEWTGPTVSLGDIDLLDYLIQHGWSCSPVSQPIANVRVCQNSIAQRQPVAAGVR